MLDGIGLGVHLCPKNLRGFGRCSPFLVLHHLALCSSIRGQEVRPVAGKFFDNLVDGDAPPDEVVGLADSAPPYICALEVRLVRATEAGGVRESALSEDVIALPRPGADDAREFVAGGVLSEERTPGVTGSLAHASGY